MEKAPTSSLNWRLKAAQRKLKAGYLRGILTRELPPEPLRKPGHSRLVDGFKIWHDVQTLSRWESIPGRRGTVRAIQFGQCLSIRRRNDYGIKG